MKVRISAQNNFIRQLASRTKPTKRQTWKSIKSRLTL